MMMLAGGPRRHTTCLFEVLMAVLMLDIGIRLALSPGLLEQSHMRLILSTMSAYGLIAVCIAVGFTRVVVLTVEGLLGRYGLTLRIAVSFLSCLIWSLMVFAFLEHFLMSHAPLPPGFDMLSAQAIGEMIVLYKLGTEA